MCFDSVCIISSFVLTSLGHLVLSMFLRSRPNKSTTKSHSLKRIMDTSFQVYTYFCCLFGVSFNICTFSIYSFPSTTPFSSLPPSLFSPSFSSPSPFLSTFAPLPLLLIIFPPSLLPPSLPPSFLLLLFPHPSFPHLLPCLSC